jgi:hypothetical protein
MCWPVYAQIPGFYAYQRGRKLGEVIGARPTELQVRTRRVFQGEWCILTMPPRICLLPRLERHSPPPDHQQTLTAVRGYG